MESTTPPHPLESLQKVVNPELVAAINAVSKHFNYTTASHDGELSVRRDREAGSTHISLPLETTLAQLFETSKKGEGTHDSSILLIDTARLLAKQEVVQNSAVARSFVEDLYRVGYLMEYGIQPNPSDLSTITIPPEIDPTESLSLFDNIILQPLSHKGQGYENELAFWMIGRGDSSTHGYWTRLEKRNKNKVFGGGAIVDQTLIFPNTDILDTDKLRAQLPDVLKLTAQAQQDRISNQDKRLPQIFPRLLNFFVHQLEWNAKRTTTDTSSSTPNHTQVGINRVMDSTATQRVTKILYDNATTNIKDNLEVPPPDRLQYISHELKSIFGENQGYDKFTQVLNMLKSIFGKSPEYDQFNAAFADSAKLFDAVDKLSNTEAWKDRATIDKVRDIWDIVQAYEHKETFSPKRAIEARAFECSLKSYISGLLIRQNIPNAQIAFWSNNDHVKLMIQDDKKIYSYDANVSMSNDFDRHIGVTDRSVVHQPSYREIGLDPLSEVAGRRFFATGIDQYGVLPGAEGYHLITDFDKGAVASIFGNVFDITTDIPTKRTILQSVIKLTPYEPNTYYNLAHIAVDPEEQRRLYRKAIELNPNFANAYYSLAHIAVDPEEQRRLYRKAIELNPNFANAYYSLARIAVDPEEQRRLYRKVIELNPNFAKAYYCLAVLLSDLSEKIKFFHTALELSLALKTNLQNYVKNLPDTEAELKTALSRLLQEFP